jgi:hypothetical protein
MTAFGIAVAVLLLAWCALPHAPLRWRPVGIYLAIEKWLAIGYVPFIVIAGAALAITGAAAHPPYTRRDGALRPSASCRSGSSEPVSRPPRCTCRTPTTRST